MLLGISFYGLLAGIAVGYAYCLFKTTLKRKMGFDIWPTPSLLKSVAKIYLDWSTPPNDYAWNREEPDE